MEIIKLIIEWAIPFACAGGVVFVRKQLKFNKAKCFGLPLKEEK